MTPLLSAAQRTDLQALLRAWYRTQPAAQDLDTAEEFATEVGHVVAACLFECGATACGTRAGYCGTRRPCACGQAARFVGYRPRWVRGVPGEAKVTRAYYHCAPCGTGVAPWDAAQGLDQRVYTPRCKAFLTEVCVEQRSYGEAQRVLARRHHFPVEVSTLEEIVADVGGRLRATEDAGVAALFTEDRLPEADPLLAEAVDKRFYLSLDAAKAHVDGAWHDIKVAAGYVGLPPSARAQAAGQTWDRSGSKRYVAIQEPSASFGRRAYTAALQWGCERAQEVVILGDGADWIWKIAEEHFSDAVQILDFYHASEHIWAIARTVFGAESVEGKRWGEQCSQQLQEAGVPGLLAGLRALRGRVDTAALREAVLHEVNYFRRHRRQLRYPEYRRRGMMIGSGPVEAGCKLVVGTRLKGPGMRWSARGADALLAARAALLGGQQESIARHARAA